MGANEPDSDTALEVEADWTLAGRLREVAAGWALVLDSEPTNTTARAMVDLLDAIDEAVEKNDPWLFEIAEAAHQRLGRHKARRQGVRELRACFEIPAEGHGAAISEHREALLKNGLQFREWEPRVILAWADDFITRLSLTPTISTLVPMRLLNDEWESEAAAADFDSPARPTSAGAWEPHPEALEKVRRALTQTFGVEDPRRRNPLNLLKACLRALGVPDTTLKNLR